jgi:predicted N-formylglutamate amidohydrolase
VPQNEHTMARLNPPEIVLTCEHASRRFPTELGSLGLSAAQRRSHIAWDRGAASLTRALAVALDGSALLARYSRIVADLNRSPSHPRVVPRVAFGTSVPGNAHLTRAERAARLARYHTPWRDHVYAVIARAVSAPAGCIHLSVHSFTPTLHGVERNADVGLLYDPQRVGERLLAGALRERLAGEGLAVRRNYPYRGTADGFTTWCRRRFSSTRYMGIEIELNQRLVGRARVQRRVIGSMIDVLGAWRP